MGSITRPDLPPPASSEVPPVVLIMNGKTTPSTYPFQSLEISFGVILNIAGLSLALGWTGCFCLLPVFLSVALVVGNMLKSKREEYFMRNGSEATRHPASKALYILAIFSFLVGIIFGMVVNSVTV